MSLTAKDKAAVKALWAKIGKSSDAIGAESLGRLFSVYPQTKIYFPHWPDLSMGSAQVKKHGKAQMDGIALGIATIDDMTTGLAELSDLHARQLKIDPANFRMLFHSIMVVIAMMFPKEFTEEAHLAFDKFLANLGQAVSEKYR